MRLFLGIELPEDIKTYIEERRLRVAPLGKGWTNAYDLHLTLLFIGETNREHLNGFIQRMEKIKFHQCCIQITRPEFFNRRILYLGLQHSLELLDLKQKIDENFSEWAMAETKNFVPHITLKRWQRHEYSLLQKQIEEFRFSPQTFKAEALTLFESRKDERDYKYHPIHRTFFRDGPDSYESGSTLGMFRP